MTHDCARPGCTAQIPFGMLMCRADWARVPRPIQRRVYAGWNGGQPTSDWLDAVDAAVAAVGPK